MAKKTIAISQDIDCFEMNGKTYAFKGKKFIYNSEKITVEEAFKNAELLESLVKSNSDLIYEVKTATENTEGKPKTPNS